MVTERKAMNAIVLKMIVMKPLESFKNQGLIPVLFQSKNERTTKTSKKIRVTNPSKYIL